MFDHIVHSSPTVFQVSPVRPYLLVVFCKQIEDNKLLCVYWLGKHRTSLPVLTVFPHALVPYVNSTFINTLNHLKNSHAKCRHQRYHRTNERISRDRKQCLGPIVSRDIYGKYLQYVRDILLTVRPSSNGLIAWSQSNIVYWVWRHCLD